MRRFYFSCTIFILSFLSVVRATSPQFSGRTLEEALRQIQLQGINVVYSNDLVQPEMRVMEEPKAASYKDILAELLAPHGLQIRYGPAKTLLVVQNPAIREIETQKSRGSRSDLFKARLKVDQEYVFVPFVNVYLTAEDSKDGFVTDLRKEDITLKEDGKELPISDLVNFSLTPQGEKEERPPLTIFFMMDGSQSMTTPNAGVTRQQFMRQAALQLLDEARKPDDRIVIMGFNETTWMISKPTDTTDIVRQELQSYQLVGGKTALFDATMTAMEKLNEIYGRKILVICSDGEDNYSSTRLENLLLALQSSDVTVLCFGITDERSISRRGKDALEKMAEVTGGYAFFSGTESDLNSNMEKARRLIRAQYAAGYVPPNPSQHGWRRVQIECKLRGIHLHYRKSYLF